MDIVIGIVIGLVVGAVLGYFILQAILKKSYASKVEEINAKADLEIKEARTDR